MVTFHPDQDPYKMSPDTKVSATRPSPLKPQGGESEEVRLGFTSNANDLYRWPEDQEPSALPPGGGIRDGKNGDIKTEPVKPEHGV